MLQISNLYAGYESMVVLSDLNLTVERGEIVAIIGRNGTGKTTLMRAIMGLVKVPQGRILFEGSDISMLPAHMRVRMGIGYVPQGRQIFPKLSVLDNLRVAAGGRHPSITEVLAKYPVLSTRLQARGETLSGGEQQILTFARALVRKPRLLLVDEPTEGLQPSIVDLMLEEMRTANQKEAVTILLTEQNLDFAMELAHRALVMEKGRIVRELPPQELLKDKDIQAEYLGV